jgi:hypothetical protein
MAKLKLLAPLVKPLTFDNGKKFAEHARIDTVLQSTSYLRIRLLVGKGARMKTSMDCCGNTSPRKGRYRLWLMRSLE